jgi:hypothetical protein
VVSPAIDMGGNPLMLIFDQRGVGYCREVEYILNDQQFDPRADIGAFELQSRLPTVVSVTTNSQPQHSMVTSIIVEFSEPVTLPNGVNAAFKLDRVGPNNPTGWVNLNGTINAEFVTLTFATGGDVGIDPAGSLIDGIYQLKIIGANVTGALGLFDGNCDGVGGDNWEIIGNQDNGLFRLFGDGNGDGVVNATDFNLFRLTYGLTSIDPGFNFAFDYNGDGNVNAADYNQFRLRYGIDLFP